MVDRDIPYTTWICQGKNYVIEITVNQLSNALENMLRMFRYRQVSSNTNRKTYILNIHGPNVLIMNDPDRLTGYYDTYYPGYNVRSADGTMEFMLKHEALNNRDDITSVTDLSEIREWITDTSGYVFAYIPNQEDYETYDWNIPFGIKENEAGVAGESNGSGTFVQFRTISRRGLTPSFVSFKDESLFRMVAHKIYSPKIGANPPATK